MSIFGQVKENKNNNNNVETSVNLGPALRYLSQSKGKLEIAFQKNENPEYESLCLVFIKIPIYGSVIDILKEVIENEGYNSLPLSKGKLSVDSKDETFHSFVAAIRIKSIDKSSAVILSVVDKMKTMLKNAIIISKKDNIGNIKTDSFDKYNSYSYGQQTHTGYTAPSFESKEKPTKSKKRVVKPHTFGVVNDE